MEFKILIFGLSKSSNIQLLFAVKGDRMKLYCKVVKILVKTRGEILCLHFELEAKRIYAEHADIGWVKWRYWLQEPMDLSVVIW